MKLIFCPHCQDIVRLMRSVRYCNCGKSSGKYLEDGLHAETSNDAIPLGFHNFSFLKAVGAKKGTFRAFIIDLNTCSTIKRIDET